MSIFDAVERDLARLTHHQDPQPYHDPDPATPATEAPVSLITELKDDAASFVAKLEHVDEEAVTKVEALKSTPEGAEVFNLVADLAKSVADEVVPKGTLATVSALLKSVESLVLGGGTSTVTEPQPVTDEPGTDAIPA